MQQLLPAKIAFVPETESEALARYTGFGKSLFLRLWEELPDLRSAFKFARDPSTDDLWATCNCGGRSFGLQFDPNIEVIVFWNKEGQEEIGSWNDDPIEHAVARIREHYVRTT